MQLTLNHVSRHFGNTSALIDVSTTINHGTVVAVLGANGAGKSTLLKLMAGEIPAAAGKLAFDDYKIGPHQSSVRHRIMLLDTPTTMSDHKCIQPILTMLRDYRVERDSLPDEIAAWFQRLNLVGSYGKRSRGLSKGQRYKALLIGLFVVRPEIWLLDEPFSSGLDANGLQILQAEIRAHRDAGGIVIFSTQWPQQTRQLADQILVIEQASLVWDKPIQQQPSDELIEAASPPLRAVLEQLRFLESGPA